MRDLYLLDPDVIFLNHGSFGACPRPVFERYQQWQRELERQPVEFLGRRYDELIYEALGSLGNFIGTSADNLVFVPNATVGLNTVARSLDLQPDDEILTTDHEYGALDLTWQFISRETGATIVPVTLPLPLVDEQQVLDALWQSVTPRTKVIFLSHISSRTAMILPVEQICKQAREQGILTVIDGAHIPGHLRLNLDTLGADFYSGNCHKWLSAPKGAAFFYVRPDHHSIIDPLTISWGWDGDSLFTRTRWQGTRDPSAYLTVPEAIRFQQAHDWQTVYTRCHDLVVDTVQRISDLRDCQNLCLPRFVGQMATAALPSGIDPEQLKRDLYEQYRIEVPLTQHAGRDYVRVSVQAYNTPDDTAALVQALDELL